MVKVKNHNWLMFSSRQVTRVCQNL